jgi:hypothetical protein
LTRWRAPTRIKDIAVALCGAELIYQRDPCEQVIACAEGTPVGHGLPPARIRALEPRGIFAPSR